MVDKLKRKRKKRSTRTTQSQSQKVIVNIGGYTRKTKPRTGGGRSSQPQVIYQPAPIPLQPNYSTEINDLRREVKANREQPQGNRTGNLAFKEGVQGGVVQAERLGGVASQSRLVNALDLPKPELMRSPSSQSLSGFSMTGQPGGRRVVSSSGKVLIIKPKLEPLNEATQPPTLKPIGLSVATPSLSSMQTTTESEKSL